MPLVVPLVEPLVVLLVEPPFPLVVLLVPVEVPERLEGVSSDDEVEVESVLDVPELSVVLVPAATAEGGTSAKVRTPAAPTAPIALTVVTMRTRRLASVRSATVPRWKGAELVLRFRFVFMRRVSARHLWRSCASPGRFLRTSGAVTLSPG